MRFQIYNASQDGWLSGRIWYAHQSYGDVFEDRQEVDDVASIMENAYPDDRIRVVVLSC